MNSSKYEQSKNALERGYLNVKVIKVIKSCKTKKQLEVAEKYIDLILLRMRDLFGDAVVADMKSITAYNYLKNYYGVLIKETSHKIYKKEYRKIFKVNFNNVLVK
jgi:hypothetical protein